MSRLISVVAIVASLVFLKPSVALADTVQLTCSEMSMSSPLFSNTGGISDTTRYHRALQISIDTAAKSIDVSDNYGSETVAGTFPVTITDATYEWDDNVAFKNGYSHYILDRYTTDLHAINTPLPKHEVIQMTMNYECKKLDRKI